MIGRYVQRLKKPDKKKKQEALKYKFISNSKSYPIVLTIMCTAMFFAWK